MINKKKIAVTLNETLIAVALVGTISVLTLGTISNEIQERILNDSKIVFNNEVAVAAADMQANKELAGYKDQTSFNEAFSKYFEVKQVTGEEVEQNFAKEYKDENGNTFTPYSFTTSDGKTIKLENQSVSSKGVSFAYTYDTACNPHYQFSQDVSEYRTTECAGANDTDSRKQDRKDEGSIQLQSSSKVKYNYIAKNEALSCIKGFYDVNGPKGPNKVGEDVGFLSEIKKDCQDSNFIPDAFGRCPEDIKGNSIIPPQTYCALTDANCKVTAEGKESLKSLDRKTCKCVCNVSCPRGLTLNPNTCTCGCDEAKILKQIGCSKDANGNYYKDSASNSYADCAESAKRCAPVSNNMCGESTCQANGGVWDKDKLTCTCTNTDEKLKEAPYFGLAKGDPKNCCMPKCIADSKNSTFDSLVRSNAKKKLSNASEVNIAVSSTLADSLANHCFRCQTSSDENISINKNNGFCTAQCATAEDPSQYPFFDFHSVDASSNKCTWTCNTTKLNNYVAELNSKGTIRPYISSNQALSYAQIRYPSAYSIGGGTSCTQCGSIKNSFNSNSQSQKFAGFLCSINNGITTSSFCNTFRNYRKNASDYNLRYEANYDKCSVKLSSFEYGKAPSDVISFHCTNDLCLQATFTYKNTTNATSPKLPNPNNSIAVPSSFAKRKTSRTQEHSDKYWNNQITGVEISYEDCYDPLALNIGSKQEDYPSSGTATKFKFKYNKEARAYEEIPVLWQNENTFAFIVDKDAFSKSGGQHVGNMLSDVYSEKANKQFNSGFAQLKEQYDINDDGLVSRDEFRGKLYIWKKSDNSYTPLTDFVFDINTWSKSESNQDGSAKQNGRMVYDISGKYRRLIPLTKKPNCTNTTCFVYDGLADSNTAQQFQNAKVVEKWKKIDQNMYTNPEIYYWMPVGSGSESKNYQWNTWYKSDTSAIPAYIAKTYKLYYYENGKWYEVKVYNLTDIVFKSKV